MHLVDDAARKRRRLKPRIRPGKCRLIVDARQPMHAIRLPLRTRIGIAAGIVVDEKSVIGASARILHLEPPPIAIVGPLHGLNRAAGFDGHALWQMAPKLQTDASLTPASRTSSATGNRCSRFCSTRFFRRSPLRRKGYSSSGPAGSSTVVEPNPPPSRTFQRGASTAT